MESKRKQLGKPMCRRVSVLLICALILGMLPMPEAPVRAAGRQAAAEADAKAGQTTLSNPTTDANGVTTWDTIYFGNYWQNDTNGDGKADQEDEKEPIRWRVLSVDGDDAFLLADQNLDCQPYNDTETDVTWETCTLRSWLNDTFLNNAFTAAEQSAIRETVVENPNNPEYETEGGNDTTDQVYLLSIEEVTNPEYGFSSDSNEFDESRRAKNTEYAKAQGAYTNTDEYAGNGWWWLRSPSSRSGNASAVLVSGGVYRYGYDVINNNRAARPALHLNPSSDSGWSYAGMINSESAEGQLSSPSPTTAAKPISTPGPTTAAKPTSTPTVFRTASPAVTRKPIESGVPGTLSNPTTDADGVTTWDTIYFGNYWQNDTNGDGKADQEDEKEPIRWRVLSVDGDDAFLLADQNLDCQPYNDDTWGVTWEMCTLRNWLNDAFLNNAFTAAERLAIRETVVENPDNPRYGTWGGNDTTDQVYLLSIDEVTNPEYGFSSDSDENDKSRRAKNTEYAKTQGASTYTDGEYAGNGYWWLRSTGNRSGYAASVYISGYMTQYGYNVLADYKAVRPALHLNLSSTSGWSYAGTINSEGTAEQTPSPSPAATRKPVESGVPGTLNNPTTDANGVTTWDTIYFGNYWQNDTNGDGEANQNDEKELIRWRVLSVDGDDAFLLADQNLDCQPYNEIRRGVTWETCTLRRWLNDNFLNNAFTAAEQSAIREKVVENPDNPEYGSEGGNDTTDQVYLLSIDEVTNPEYGFSSDYKEYDKSRWAKNTEYAKTQGVYTNTYGEYVGNGWWWLRSPGYNRSQLVSDVSSSGDVDRYGYGVIDSNGAARPALHLNLSSDSGWSYAGTVNSEGTYEQPSSPGPTTAAKPTLTPTVLRTASPTVTRKPVESSVPSTLNNPTTDADGVTTWDTIYFGSYWQNDTNGDGKADQEDEKEPIRWRVLSVDGDDAFLLSDQNLDCQRYNGTYTDVTWETCTMRSWLNDTFLNNAFTAAEQSVIRETVVENPDNPKYGTEGGNDTIDKVYLLSIDEVTNPEYGFSSDYNKYDKSRWAKNTEYAKGHRAYTDTYGKYVGNGWWWLRSPGLSSSYASYVHYSGDVFRFGSGVSFDGIGGVIFDGIAVRPALHLNLSSDSSWSYAGTVNSEGTYKQPPTPGPTTAAKPTSTPTALRTASPAATRKPVESGVPGTLSNPTTDADGVTTWDTIYFGSYWQNDTNGDGTANQEDEKEPIRWRVLSVDGDDAFLLADQNLDCQPYNDTYTDVTWETCTLRNWLNDTFLNNAFTAVEQSAIRETVVENLNYSVNGTEGGNDTIDQIYLLSMDEVRNPEYGFSSNSYEYDKSRRAKNTEYARGRGAYTRELEGYGGSGEWWLRTLGFFSGLESKVNRDSASYVCTSGLVDNYGCEVNRISRAVRPALHLNLSSTSGWSYAGTVNSESTDEQPSSQAPAATRKPVESGVPSTLNNPTTDADGITTWDTIYFGNYWQNDTDGDGKANQNDDKEAIRWRVLSMDGDDALLLADQSLDCRQYNSYYTKTDVTWERCTLRSWLNGTFLNNAFTSSEQSAIRETIVENPHNPEYGIEGGNNTIDQVYLLSIDEVTNSEYGFSSDYNTADKRRTAKNTEYAKEQGGHIQYVENGFWWLRSPGSKIKVASFVDDKGNVAWYGNDIDHNGFAVRPALHLNLSSATGWSYAGTVNSEGTYEQPSSPAPTATAKPTSTPIVIATASPAATTKPSATPTDPGTKPTENPGTNPDATPGIAEQPSAEPTENPDITPGPTDPGTKPTENPGTNPDMTASPEPQKPGETPGIPAIKPNDNTQPQPSASVPNQPAGSQQPDSSKAEENEGIKQDTSLSQPKAGTVLTISGIQYKVQSTSGRKKTVVFLKAADKKLKKATIPNTIQYKSETYEVVEISKNAFKGCKSLTKVTIGSKVKVIGRRAFSGCKKLKTVTIRSKVLKKIGTGAFAGVNPKAKLKAPKSKISQYRKLMKKAGWHK